MSDKSPQYSVKVKRRIKKNKDRFLFVGACMFICLVIGCQLHFHKFPEQDWFKNSRAWILTGAVLTSLFSLSLAYSGAVVQNLNHIQGSKVVYQQNQTVDEFTIMHKSLDYLKDWSTTLITIQIGIIGAVLAAQELVSELKDFPAMLLLASALTAVYSLYFNGTVLYMLPAIAMRQPKNHSKDVYSLTVKSNEYSDYEPTTLSLGFYCSNAWWSFVASFILILISILFQVL